MSSGTANNRRGAESRQEILDVASRIMAINGYAGTAISTLVKETGLPRSSIYHHFRSKAGLLTAIMERGAKQFFSDMRREYQNPPQTGTPRDIAKWYLQRTTFAFTGNREFLRLLFLLSVSNDGVDQSTIRTTIKSVRAEGRTFMNAMIVDCFVGRYGEQTASEIGNRLEYFGMAGFDGAFLSVQSGDPRSIADSMDLLAEAIAALGEDIAASVRGRATTRKRPRRQATQHGS